ncbi:MAG: universal stress protein [Natrialbaceae archaeon]|nr:universal stress protein [Natrialbaceae archaeon]
MYSRILVATDGSDAANRAVEHGLDLAETFSAELHAIYVVDTTRYGRSILGQDDGVLEELEERGEELLEEIEERGAIDVTTAIRRGQPHEEIDQYADEINADLILVGNRGMSAPDGTTLGSVAERVVRYSGRPVVTA